jgi:hypothetical protein
VWTLVSSPNEPLGTTGLYDDTLWGVGGSSPNDVWAVGNNCCHPHGSQDYYHALIEHWNGSGWKIVKFAKNEPADSQLRAVSATGPDDAWAVGYSVFPNAALFEHWNGRRWSVVSSPYIYNGSEMLSVKALSPTDAWAVGEGNGAAIAEHWDGKQWSYIPGYTMGGLTVLTGVAATASNDVMAIGNYYAPNANLFSEHWNGTSWSYVAPLQNTSIAQFNGVAAIGKSDYWAVGYQTPSSNVPQTLIERWTGGSKWSIVGSPNLDPPSGAPLFNTLNGVVSLSSKDAWAVGMWTWFYGDGTPRSLFERWNGRKWIVAAGPATLETNNNNASNELLGIARAGSGTLWAVGNQTIPPACCNETLTVETTHG